VRKTWGSSFSWRLAESYSPESLSLSVQFSQATKKSKFQSYETHSQPGSQEENWRLTRLSLAP